MYRNRTNIIEVTLATHVVMNNLHNRFFYTVVFGSSLLIEQFIFVNLYRNLDRRMKTSSTLEMCHCTIKGIMSTVRFARKGVLDR